MTLQSHQVHPQSQSIFLLPSSLPDFFQSQGVWWDDSQLLVGAFFLFLFKAAWMTQRVYFLALFINDSNLSCSGAQMQVLIWWWAEDCSSATILQFFPLLSTTHRAGWLRGLTLSVEEKWDCQHLRFLKDRYEHPCCVFKISGALVSTDKVKQKQNK